MITELYYSGRTHNYYIIDTKKCFICDKTCTDILMININYRLKRGKARTSHYEFYCKRCYQKKLNLGEVRFTLVAVVSSKIPARSWRVFLKPPTITTASNLSTFDVQGIDALGGSMIDNTKYANRVYTQKFIEQDTHTKSIMEEIKMKDRERGLKEGMNLLERMKA